MLYFVLHVQTGKERDFRKRAETIPGSASSGSFYIPFRELEIRRNGITKKEEKPVFPGYIFWCTENFDVDIYWHWKKIEGFVRILGPKGAPCPLVENDLDLLQHLMGFGDILGLSQATFDEADRIVILAGPLKGLEGRICAVDKRKKRARVQLDLYQSPFTIDFGFEVLTPEGKVEGK